jgi:protein-tyrosine-phosphatase
VKLRVLFLCAANSVQSPIAECLLRAVDSEHFEVVSAGIESGETHPLAIETMKDIGVDLQGRATKAAREVSESGFDFVITLCERARFECPEFRGAELVHWQLDDPLAASDYEKQRRLFLTLRDQIAQRVRLFALVQVRFTPDIALKHRDPDHGHSNFVHS